MINIELLNAKRLKKAEEMRWLLREKAGWNEEDHSSNGCTDIMFEKDGIRLSIGDDCTLLQTDDIELTVGNENTGYVGKFLYLYLEDKRIQVRVDL